jgi:chorismate mutase
MTDMAGTLLPAHDAIPAGDLIATARQRIDHVDQEIIELLLARRELSRQIQVARMDAGGVRVELGREAAIVGRYRERFAAPGAQLAMTLLDICRGRLGGHDHHRQEEA